MSTVTYDGITATFSGTGALTGATAQLNGATIAIVEGYSSLGSDSFMGATTLTSVTLPSSVTSIGYRSFQGATSLTSITIPAGVTSIGSNAFQGATSLESIIFEENSQLTSIGQGAFDGARSLTSISIPAGVTSIGQEALKGATSLTDITVVSSNTIYKDISGVLFNYSGTTLIQYPVGNTTRTSYEIPAGVTSIGNSLFRDATSLTSITIPASVTTIGEYAFYGTLSLTSLTFEENSQLTSIGQNAFRGARSLTSISIPVGVTSIGNSLFRDATSLTSISIPAGVTTIGQNAFQGATSLTDITVVPSNTIYKDISGVLFNFSGTTLIQYPGGNTTRTSYEIPDSVTTIGSSAFQFTNLISITIPAGVTTIGNNAFRDSNLESIIFAPNSQLTSIGQYAFNSATRLVSISIPEGVTILEIELFYNATSLTSVTIPTSVTTIGNNAFYRTLSLTSINVDSDNPNYSDNNGVLFNKNKTTLIQYTLGSPLTEYIIPAIVTSITTNAFTGSVNLTSIQVDSDNPNYSDNNGVLFNKNKTTLLQYPLGNSRTEYIIPEGVTSIGQEAFVYAISLTSISIPASVTSIGLEAFQDTTSLTHISIPASNGLNIPSPASDVSFFGRTVTTTTITLPPAAAAAAAAAVLANTNFNSVLSNIGVDTGGMTSVLNIIASNPRGKIFNGVITIPNGVFGNLTDDNKSQLIAKIKESYATALSVDEDRIRVTLSSGSIIATVDVYESGSVVPICFPAGTPVTTDQGFVPIEKLNPDKHTIDGKKIVAITQTRPLFKEIVSIKKNALANNVPSQNTQISNHHMVSYQGNMIQACELANVCEGVNFIPYNGETLYNVLLEKHSVMTINNMVCETLHPRNVMAIIYGSKFNTTEKDKLLNVLASIFKKRDRDAYYKIISIVDGINQHRKSQTIAK